MKYEDFIQAKTRLAEWHGLECKWLPDLLFDFQRDIVKWALKKPPSHRVVRCLRCRERFDVMDWKRHRTCKRKLDTPPGK